MPPPNKEKEKLAVVVSGFPGVGKSTLFQNPGELTFLDSDSTDFSWANKEKRLRHPDWPQNYIDHITANRKRADVILVSSHKEVRDALVENDTPFVLVYPSLEMKEEYIQRYVDRGSDANFVELLNANYEKWIQELMEQDGARHVVLKPGQYLSDVVDNIRQ